MKTHPPALRRAMLALIVSAASLQADPSAAVVTLANVQDERAVDVETVQTALQGATSAESRAAILQAFQQRESARAAQAGAASLQIELGRRAAAKAGIAAQPVPNAAASREISTSSAE